MDMPSAYIPDLGRSFQSYTDDFSTAIGVCLLQKDSEGNKHPISFYSKKLTPTQSRWSIIEYEANAVLAALKRFDTGIFGAQVEVIFDHNPLT